MKIALEATTLCSDIPTGIARYARNLIDALQNQLINDDQSSLSLLYSLSSLKYRDLYYTSSNVKIHNYWKSITFPKLRVDIVHGLDNKLPKIKSAKHILTIHDLFLHLNTSNEMSPTKFREKKDKELREKLNYIDAIVTVSHNTKKDITKLFGFPENKIFVTHLGINENIIGKKIDTKSNSSFTKFGITKPYLFFVGSISARKNTERLVQAFNKSKLKDDFQLVLAGNISYHGEKTVNAAKQCNSKNSVIILDYCSDKDIALLHANAKAFMFPTLYEGFGIPIIEAFRNQVPVLTSTTGSAPEVANGYATLVDPMSIDEITKGMETVINTPQEKTEEAFKYSQTFTWNNCAQQTLDCYKHLIL